ncbi:uncharacterized protein EAF01_000613 [Botrytis porri]|uniref:uncharacterized protein n=1 Tax=Botrytis porri TaxID=87229 RepID=UPI001900FB11|nr:uncharacterized protein EAF01_000613 [Botrytis porri]KAF7914207.1 hypothetical protein EAF01_000613 [Botrytis porri]
MKPALEIKTCQAASPLTAAALSYFGSELAPGEQERLGQEGGGKTMRWRIAEEYQLCNLKIPKHEGPNLDFRENEEDWSEFQRKQGEWES